MSVTAAVDSPRVSIIVLSYDRPAYLRAALDSIVAQTADGIEIVMADDASSNAEVDALLCDYSKRIANFRYERRSENVGVVANLLRAAAAARGRYVTILCDDDTLEPDYVARLSDALDADPHAVVAFCGVTVMDAGGVASRKETQAFDVRWQRHGLRAGTIFPMTETAIVTRSLQLAMGALFVKDAVDWTYFPEETSAAWDSWLAYLLSRSGGACIYVPDRLFRYRVHAKSLTSRRDPVWNAGQRFTYETLLADRELVRHRTFLASKVAYYHYVWGTSLLRRGEQATAAAAFASSLRFRRSSKARLGRFLASLPARATLALFAFYDGRSRWQR